MTMKTTYCTNLLLLVALTVGQNCLAKQPAPTAPRPSIFEEEQIRFFHKEGYLHVKHGDRELLGDGLIKDLAMAAQSTMQMAPRFPFFYSVSQTGLLFGSTQADDGPNPKNQQNNTKQAFRNTALYSKLPQAVAELMQLDPSKHNLRVLRDVFLAKSVEDAECCDWHVDDLGFWPESFLSGGEGMDGINVWIALDDMPAAFQGSMAVAPRSHTSEWRHQAYQALGQNRTVDGGKTKEQVILQRMQQAKEANNNKSNTTKPQSKYPTCDMHLADPQVREKIDATKTVLDLKRGDIIFATRLLFHRTLPVTEAGLEHYRENGIEHLSRYSIRYVPGAARLPNGWSVEWSIVEDDKNAGRSLDAVIDHGNKLFYPQVWPSFEPSLEKGLLDMEESLPSLAERAQAEFMATIFGNHGQTTTSS